MHICQISVEMSFKLCCARIHAKINFAVDPLGRPTVFAHVVRTSVPTFQNLGKQNKATTMFDTGETVGLAEWIIDDTCLVFLYFVELSICLPDILGFNL